MVAEGVEEESQLEVLRRLDCDFAQGYLFGAPLWPDRLRAALEGAVEPSRTRNDPALGRGGHSSGVTCR